MNELSLLWIAGLIVLVLVVISWRAERVYAPLRRTEGDIQQEMHNLNATINTLRRQLDAADKRVALLEAELATTRAELAAAQLEIKSLRATIETYRDHSAHGRQLLLIQGADNDVAGMDEASIAAIGIRYTRLRMATRDSVNEEFLRVAEDGRSYPWVLISAHAAPQGVMLADGLANNDFWMRILRGVRVVALAACATTALADHLRDRVDFVWYFREDVPTEAANRFMTRFFQSLYGGSTPLDAFVRACEYEPLAAPYADYRQHKP